MKPIHFFPDQIATFTSPTLTEHTQTFYSSTPAYINHWAQAFTTLSGLTLISTEVYTYEHEHEHGSFEDRTGLKLHFARL